MLLLFMARNSNNGVDLGSVIAANDNKGGWIVRLCLEMARGRSGSQQELARGSTLAASSASRTTR